MFDEYVFSFIALNIEISYKARKFREGTYHISVKNPANVEKGIKSMTVNGVPVKGCIIPYVKGLTEYQVEVVMG